jgi:hypothetical protein
MRALVLILGDLESATKDMETKELQWRPPLQLPLQINVAAQAACQD